MAKTFRRKRPVMVMLDENLTHRQMVGAYLGVFRTLDIAEVAGEVSVSSSYEWLRPVCVADEQTGYTDFLELLKDVGKKASVVEGSLNADAMFDRMRGDPLCDENYLVAVLADPLYGVRFPNDEKMPLCGVGDDGIGAILTITHSQTLTPKEHEVYMEILTSHELGHAFGLIPEQRTAEIDKDKFYGTHCARHECVMSSESMDEVMLQHAIVREQLFCPRCVVGMLDYFLEEKTP